jgi:tetratricopeptide (TPR) repeat protein
MSADSLRRATRTSGSPLRRRALWSAFGLAAAAAVALGGWYVVQASQRAEARDAALKPVRDGRYADAIPGLQSYLDRYPDDAEALHGLVACLIKTGAMMAEVEPYLDRLIALRPDAPEPLRARADLRNRVGRKGEALADALRALEIAPGHHPTRRLVAWLAVDLGEKDIAERELGVLLAESSYPRAELGAKLALSRLQADDLAGAQEALDRYVPPDSSAGLVLRGALHHEAGRYERAVELLRSAEPEDDAERQFALNYLALSLARLGKADESREAFDRLSALYRAVRYAEDAAQRPGDRAAQVRAARANLEAGRPREAARLLEAALARLGDDADALAALAECYDRLGRADLAGSARRRAAEAAKK